MVNGKLLKIPALVSGVMIRVKHGQSNHICFILKSKEEGMIMLNYEEELKKYKPNLGVDQTETAIYENDLTDISDILDQI